MDDEGTEIELTTLSRQTKRHTNTCERIRKSGYFTVNYFERLLWIGKIAWLVDRRKVCNLIANHYLGVRLERICRDYSLLYDDVAFLTPSELAKVIDGTCSRDFFSLDDRKNGGIYLCDVDGNDLFLIGDEADTLWDRILASKQPTEISSVIRGKIGFGGMVRGRVRRIMDAYDAEDFRIGDVLVTDMTRPDFLPLMRKAAAFITDEGGITCHAAIVARELKKPCIIGTKIATQVLHDGDLVEVDADYGVVRVLDSL